MHQAPHRLTSRRRLLAIPMALATSALLLAACAGSPTPASTSGSGAAPATSAAGAAATSKPTTAPVSSPAAAAPAASAKVSANNASIAELQQAFEAAGIPNAARWAREVDEYRPYPTNDPGFAKLRQELSKYNPSPDVLEKIIATLALT